VQDDYVGSDVGLHTSDSNTGYRFNPSDIGNHIHFRVALDQQSDTHQTPVTAGLLLSPRNLVIKSKAVSEDTKSLFLFLGNITIVHDVFDHVFKTSGCLENIQDAVELMDNSYDLVAKNAPDLIYLEAIIKKLTQEKNIAKIIQVPSKMLRILEDLIPKLDVKTPKKCLSSLKASAEDFKGLSHFLKDVLNHRDISLPENQRQIMQRSSKTMYDVAKFLIILDKSLETFKTLCSHNKTRFIALDRIMAKVTASFAALYKVLGSEKTSDDVLRQGEIIARILDALRDSNELSSKLYCGANGAYEELAISLDDLAEIVQNVGLESLSTELGVDLDYRLITSISKKVEIYQQETLSSPKKTKHIQASKPLKTRSQQAEAHHYGTLSSERTLKNSQHSKPLKTIPRKSTKNVGSSPTVQKQRRIESTQPTSFFGKINPRKYSTKTSKGKSNHIQNSGIKITRRKLSMDEIHGSSYLEG